MEQYRRNYWFYTQKKTLKVLTSQVKIVYHANLIKKGGWVDGSILREVSCEARNERRQADYHEERETGNARCMPHLWNEDVPNWEKLEL